MRRWIIRFIILDLIISVFWFGWPFLQSSKTQVIHQQTHFLKLTEQRKWPELYLLMTPDYKDQWGQPREQALGCMKQLLGAFFIFNIDTKFLEVSVDGKTAKAAAIFKISGNGAGVSQMVVDTVNHLKQPFVFVWKKEGWKPGDWKLATIEQPELEGALHLDDQ